MKKIFFHIVIMFFPLHVLNAQLFQFSLNGRIPGRHLISAHLESFSKSTLNVDTSFIFEDSFIIKGRLKDPHLVLLNVKTDSIENSSRYFIVDSGEHNLKITFNDSIFNIDNVSNSLLETEYLYHFLPFIYLKEFHKLPTDEDIQAIKIQFENNFFATNMKFVLEYLQMHSRSFVGFLIFQKKTGFARPEDNELFQKAFLSLDTSIRYTASGKEFLKFLKNESSLLVGKKFPHFIIKGIDNKTDTVRYKRNSLTLIDFWATWCMPCLREIPMLRIIHDKYGNNKFNIISISVDDTKDRYKLKKFVDSLQMNWMNYWDENRKTSEEYKIFLFPTYFLLGDKGEIITRGNSLKPILKIMESRFE